MEDQLKQLSAAVLQGLQSGNRDAGTGNSAVNQFVSGLFGDILGKPAAGVGQFAGAVADRQEQEREAARQAEIRRLSNKMDPSKYRQVRKDDGGFDFFDPEGNPISVKDFAKFTGRSVADVLAKSENPFDIQFLNDYSSTRNLVDAIQTGDQEAIQGYLQNGEGIDASKTTAADLMAELAKKYPHIYGMGNYGQSFAQSNNKPLFRLNSGMGFGGGSGGGGNSISSLLK